MNISSRPVANCGSTSSRRVNVSRWVFLGILSIALVAACDDTQARTAVATPQTIQSVLAVARGGDRIVLSPGTYTELKLRNRRYEPPLEIDAGNAIVRGLYFGKVSGLIVRGGQFELAPPLAPTGAAVGQYGAAIRVDDVDRLEVTGARFMGLAALNPSPDAYGEGYGVFIRVGSDVTITGNTFVGFKSGIVLTRVQRFRVENNSFSAMRSDGIQIAESRDGILFNNNCSSTKIRDKEHPDCIQLWSRPSSPPTSDITIRHNTVRGRTQGISGFNHTRNGVNDGGFDRIVIEDNDIEVSYPHAIALFEARNSTVRNNKVRTYEGARWQARITTTGDASQCGNTIAPAVGRPGIRDQACN